MSDTMNMHVTSVKEPARVIRKPHSTWSTFAVPIVMAILSAVGLTTALVGDDHWDWISWITLGIPIAVIFSYWISHRVAKAR